MKAKLIGIGAAVLALLFGALICSNSIQGEHAQSNTTLALMTNLKMADTQKTMATTIDHMSWGYIIALAVMAIVVIIVVIVLAKVIGSRNKNSGSGDYIEPTRALPHAPGVPKMMLLNNDPRPWLKQMDYGTKLQLRARLWQVLAYLDAEIGDNAVYQDPGANIVVQQPEPRGLIPGLFSRSVKLAPRKEPAMKKNNSEINWG